MRERIRLVRGRLDIESAPGRFVVKSALAAQLLPAVEVVLGGERYVSPDRNVDSAYDA